MKPIIFATALYSIVGVMAATGLYVISSALPNGIAMLMPSDLLSMSMISGLAMYCSSLVLFSIALWWQPLAYAYPISVGATTLSASVLGVLLLGELLTMGQVIGSALILTGVVLIGVQHDAQVS